MKRTCIGLSLAIITAMGCERGADRASTTTTTAARLPPARMLLNDDAAMIVAKVRCRREAQCKDVGAGERFAGRDDCLLGLLPQEKAVVREEICPAGIDDRKLSRCVDTLLTQSCEVTRAGASQPADCQAAALCGAEQ